MKLNSLGDRMKGNYENPFRYILPHRNHIVVRIDGRSFHSFTKKLERPFCKELHIALNNSAISVCSEISGCKMAYGQSDEFSFIFSNFENDELWFSGNIQKIASIVASIYTASFNQIWKSNNPFSKLATFDARVFTIPTRNEAVNYFIWRQQDASTNSLQMLSQCNFSHKELHKKGAEDMYNMLHSKGINWNNESIEFKRGVVIKKTPEIRNISYVHKKSKETIQQEVQREFWQIDTQIPIFAEDKDYLKNLIPNQE